MIDKQIFEEMQRLGDESLPSISVAGPDVGLERQTVYDRLLKKNGITTSITAYEGRDCLGKLESHIYFSAFMKEGEESVRILSYKAARTADSRFDFQPTDIVFSPSREIDFHFVRLFCLFCEASLHAYSFDRLRDQPVSGHADPNSDTGGTVAQDRRRRQRIRKWRPAHSLGQ